MAKGSPRRAVVIGAGPAGLAAGYGLSRDGWDVLILERLTGSGGRCRTASVDGFQFDTAAQYFHDSYDSTLKTAISVGLGDRLRLPQAGGGLYRQGEVSHFYPRSLNPFKLLPWGAIGLLGPIDLPPVAKRFFSKYRNYNIKLPHLWMDGDDVTAREFLEARTTRAHRDRFAEPVALYAWGAGLDRISTSGFMVALRSTFGDRTGTFAGGMGSFTAALARRLEVKTGMEAVEVVRDRDAMAVRARPTGGGRARSYRADIVVCTVPAPLVLEITGKLGPVAESIIGEVEYTEELVVNIGFDREVSGDAGPVLLPGVEGFRAGWLCSQMSKASEYAPDGSTLVTLVFSGREAFRLMDADDQAVVEIALDDASRVLDLEGLSPSVYRVDRHEFGRPIVSPGYAERVRRLFDAGSGVKNLMLAGDWTSSPTVEGAVTSGFNAAARAGSPE